MMLQGNFPYHQPRIERIWKKVDAGLELPSGPAAAETGQMFSLCFLICETDIFPTLRIKVKMHGVLTPCPEPLPDSC